ncbi:MAG: hypothetical protein LC114_12000 [Bryobacterales bacterium]|nr:hypothetical protein [Bryobacterales bacterium]
MPRLIFTTTDPLKQQASFRAYRGVVIAVLIVVLICVIEIITVQRAEDYGSDDSIYINLAGNIVKYGAYEFNFQPHTIYPPGFPVALAIISNLTGYSAAYSLYIHMMPLFAAMGLLVWFAYLWKDLDQDAALAGCLLMVCTPALYTICTRSVISDTLYMLMSGCALLGLILLSSCIVTWRRWLIGSGVVLSVVWTVTTRSAGLTLCCAICAWIGSESIRLRSWQLNFRRLVALAAAFAGITAFLAWTIWSNSNQLAEYEGQHMASYTTQLLAKDPHNPELGRASIIDILTRIPKNIVLHSSYLGSIYMQGLWIAPLWFSPIVVLLLLTIGIAVVTSIRTGDGALSAWYMATYLAMYSIWPFDEGPRFMLPIAPLAFSLAFRGARHLTKRAQSEPRHTAFGIIAAGLVFGFLPLIFDTSRGLQRIAFVSLWLVTSFATFIGIFVFSSRFGWHTKALRAPHSHITPRVAGYFVVVGLMVIGAVRLEALAHENLNPDPSSYRHAATVDAAKWLSGAQGGVVMAGQTAILHRLSSRRIVQFPITDKPELIASVMKAWNVQFLVVCDRLRYEYFEPDEETRLTIFRRAYPSVLEEVHRGRGYQIFKVLPITNRDGAEPLRFQQDGSK